MGRPKIVEGGDPLFQRRYPQISNSFKRLPSVQETYSSTRKSPVLLSKHWTETTAHSALRLPSTGKAGASANDEGDHTNNNNSHATTTPSPLPQHRTPSSSSSPPTTTPGYQRSGGSIVHRATDANDGFADTMTRWELNTLSPEALWEWAMELRAWQDHQSDASRRSRTTKKRKLLSLPPCLLHAPANIKKQAVVKASDEEEPVWHALCNRHEGNTNQAMLYYTAQWGDGDAAEAVTANRGYAWREFLSHRRCLRTGIYTPGRGFSKSHAKHSCLTQHWDDLVIRETWEAVLSCARLIHEQTVSLSALSAFLANASQLAEASDSGISREVNTTMNAIVNKYIQARIERAKLLDLWYDPDGVNVEHVKRLMEATSSSTTSNNNNSNNDTPSGSVTIDEFDEIKRQLRTVANWQQRVETICKACNTTDEDDQRDDLTALVALKDEGQFHGFRSLGHVQLDRKLAVIVKLRERIQTFHAEEATVKAIAAIVREIHRRGVRFPLANHILRIHQSMETWLAEANAALRTVTAIESIRGLLERVEDLPMTSLQDCVAKLRVKLETGDDWLERFFAILQCNGDCFATMSQQIQSLLNSAVVRDQLEALLDESSDLPVKIDYVNLLQVEFDAHEWTKMATEFLRLRTPLGQLKSHCQVAETLRQRLGDDVQRKLAWKLPMEDEVKKLVVRAETWIAQVQLILTKKKCLSTLELVKLRMDGKAIHVDLGQPASEFYSVVEEAKLWYDANSAILDTLKNGKADFDQLEKASLDAERFAVLIEEVVVVQSLIKRLKRFHDAAAVVLGDKRGAIAPLEELESLLAEALEQPVNVEAISTRLNSKLDEIKAWKKTTGAACEAIAVAVQHVRETLEVTFGQPDQFRRDSIDKENADVEESASDNGSTTKQDETRKSGRPSSSAIEEMEKIIRDFHWGAKDLFVITDETRFADSLFKFSQWIVRSLRYLESHRDIFDKRYFGAFDRVLNQGNEMASFFSANTPANASAVESCSSIVSDQMKRFATLLSDRNAFVDLCRRAKQAISGSDGQIALSQLVDLSAESQRFPDICAEISSIRRMASEASAFAQSIRSVVNGQERIPMDEASSGLQKAKKIGFVCAETRLLGNGVKAARSWSRRVHRLCKEDDPDVSKVKTLMSEYDGLMIDLADDVELLSKTQTKYCLCQQAHKGFMVCCEECEDWFHGTCVGVTEKSAKKRFVCLRCSIVKTYQLGTSSITTLVRKWSSVAELKKARLADLKKLTLKESRQRQSLASIQVEKTSVQANLAEIKQVAEERHSNESVPVNKALSPPLISNASVGGDIPCNGVSVSSIAESANDAATSSSTSVPCPVQAIPVVEGKSRVQQIPNTGILKQQCSQIASTTLTAPPTTKESVLGSGPSQLPPVPAKPISVQPIPHRPVETFAKPIPIAPAPMQLAPDALKPQTAATQTKGQTKEPTVPSADTSQSDPTKATFVDKDGSEAGLLMRLEKLNADANKWIARIQTTVGQRNDLARGFVTEDAKYNALQSWVHQFRSTVFAPESDEKAKLSMPLRDGSLSEVTKQLIDEAKKVGIYTIPDIALIIDHMECLAWCLRATITFSRQPSLTEVTALLTAADGLSQIPNLNTIKAMKNLAVKVRAWEKLVKEEIYPIPSKKGSRFSEDKIRKLLALCDNLPLRSAYESRLVSIVEDGFIRHCLCGGPSDGRFMIGCDKCNEWFHGCCVGKTNEDMSESNTTWICPICTKTTVNLQVDRFHYLYDVEESDDDEDDAMRPSPKAPKVERMWPPIGLLQSEKAQKALGLETSLRMRYQSIHAPPVKPTKPVSNRSAVVMRSTIPIAVYGPPIQKKNPTDQGPQSNQLQALESRYSVAATIASKQQSAHGEATTQPQTAHIETALKQQTTDTAIKQQTAHNGTASKPQTAHSETSIKQQAAHSETASKRQAAHSETTSKPSNPPPLSTQMASSSLGKLAADVPQTATETSTTVGVKRPREETAEESSANGTSYHRQKIPAPTHGPDNDAATDPRMPVDLAGNA